MSSTYRLSAWLKAHANTKQYTTTGTTKPLSNTILPLPNTFNTNTTKTYYKLNRLY